MDTIEKHAVITDYRNLLAGWQEADNFFYDSGGKTWFEVRTPFLDRIGDQISVFATRVGDDLILSDDGEAVRLFELERDPPHSLLSTILQGCNVTLGKNRELLLRVAVPDFAEALNMLVGTILQINHFGQ